MQTGRPLRPAGALPQTECEPMPLQKRGRLTIWTIYREPDDYPGCWVLRAHEVFPGVGMYSRDSCFVAATLDEVRARVPPDTWYVGRAPDDHPVIYESWLAEAGGAPGITRFDN